MTYSRHQRYEREPRISFYDLKRDYDVLKSDFSQLLDEFARLNGKHNVEMRELKIEIETLKERLKRRMRTRELPECCVCYTHTETKTRCGHLVCVKCIRRLERDECPYCRTPF